MNKTVSQTGRVQNTGERNLQDRDDIHARSALKESIPCIRLRLFLRTHPSVTTGLVDIGDCMKGCAGPVEVASAGRIALVIGWCIFEMTYWYDGASSDYEQLYPDTLR